MNKLLEIKKLTKYFRKGAYKIEANVNISFSVKEGEIVGILGPNGAGKTTLLKQIATLLLPDEGDILYKGISIIKHPNIIRGKISFLLEGMRNVYHYLTGEANLLYFAYLNHQSTSEAKKKTERLLKRMGLYNVKDEYVFTYSAGMNKKLAVATCLINDPEIIFLDEPLSGLDVIAAEELMEDIKRWVREENKTFIIASHRMDFIEKVTERVLWMKEGKIVKEGNTLDMKNLTQEKEIIVYLRSTKDTEEKLKQHNLSFKKLSSTTLKLHLPLSQKKLFYWIVSNFEILNLEKKELDFETIFKELYHDKDN